MNTELASQPDSFALTGGLKFAVPLADLAEFGDLAEKRRNEVRVLLPILERVHAMVGERSLQAACEIVAGASKHLMRGLSAPSLRRKYEAFHGSAGDEFPVGNWRILVAGYKGPSKQPREFQQEVKRVSQLNNCSVGEAMQQLRERWEKGESIEGYGTWLDHYQRLFPLRPLPKVWPRGFYPVGWSVRNLRRYGSNKGARVLFQRGLAAAKRHFPSVTRDPSQLRPLELIVIDDFELDCLCVFQGDDKHKPQIGRVAGLMAMDVATRRKLHWGLGQRLEREEKQLDGTVKTVRTGIARIDVQLLLHGLFEKFGLPDYPVTLLVENAAAAISPELELSITTLFQGRVRIERTGLIEHRNLSNGFIERGGKPWEKGMIEAAFAKLWNILGAPGKIAAFIDWDDAVSGDAMDDISSMACFHGGDVVGRILAGYAEVRPLPPEYRRRFWLHLLRNMITKAVIRVGAGYFKRTDGFFLIGAGSSGPGLREATEQRLDAAFYGLRNDSDPTTLL